MIPWSAASFVWSFWSRSSSSVLLVTSFFCWVRICSWVCGLRLRQAAGERRRPDPTVLLVETPVLDREPVVVFVLRDRLAVDAPDRSEMVRVIRVPGRDDEDPDGDHDDEAEAKVQEQIPSVLAFPRRSVVALDDGFCSKCHGVRDSCDVAGSHRGLLGRRVSYPKNPFRPVGCGPRRASVGARCRGLGRRSVGRRSPRTPSMPAPTPPRGRRPLSGATAASRAMGWSAKATRAAAISASSPES